MIDLFMKQMAERRLVMRIYLSRTVSLGIGIELPTVIEKIS